MPILGVCILTILVGLPNPLASFSHPWCIYYILYVISNGSLSFALHPVPTYVTYPCIFISPLTLINIPCMAKWVIN